MGKSKCFAICVLLVNLLHFHFWCPVCASFKTQVRQVSFLLLLFVFYGGSKTSSWVFKWIQMCNEMFQTVLCCLTISKSTIRSRPNHFSVCGVILYIILLDQCELELTSSTHCCPHFGFLWGTSVFLGVTFFQSQLEGLFCCVVV